MTQFKKYLRDTLSHKEGYKKLLLHTAFALTLTSGFSYVLGFVRDRLLAQTFGASSTLDVYYAAFVIPDIILAIFVTSCVSVAFIPLFTQCSTYGKNTASEYLYNILFIITGLVIVSAIAAAVLIPYFTPYLVPGFDDSEKELYINVVRIMLLSPIIFSLSNIFGGVLLSVRDFFFYGIAPVFYNLGIIIGVAFFVPHFGIYGLAWGTVLGALLHLVSRAGIAMSRAGVPRKFSARWNGLTRKTLLLMIPKIFQIGAWQILLAWFIFLASMMDEGSVTIYSFARNFQSMPISLIGIAIALSAFTTLSYLAAQKDFKRFQQVFKKKISLILITTSIAAIVLAFISKPLISFLLGGEAFDSAAVSATAALLAVYAISIPLESSTHLLARTHYALQRVWRPSLIHVFSISLTIALGWFYWESAGLVIIPLSFAAGLLLQNIALYISYRHVIKSYTS